MTDASIPSECDAALSPKVSRRDFLCTAAAVAGAVTHATGVRVRELPITLDKLLV